MMIPPDYLNYASGRTVSVLPEKLRKPERRSRPHGGMDEEFDTVIHPHPPLPLPHMRYENHFEVDPIRIDPIINVVVRLDPITVHISRIWLVRAEASVDEYVLNTGTPKCLDGSPQAFQESTPPRSEPERLPISSSVALWLPGGNAPVAGSEAGITAAP
jgi:hypothetical protein